MKMKKYHSTVVLLLSILLMLEQCFSATNYLPYIDPNTNIIIKVLEDTAVGTSLRNITAIDLNNDNVTFSLDATGNTILNIRNIGVREGELTLKTPLNRKLTSSYSFNVRVTDDKDNNNRLVSKLFILNVLDVNDNKPVFTKQPYKTSIPENTTVNTTLMTIQATDADQAANAVVEYRFSNDSSLAAQENHLLTLWQTSKFSIDNLHGTITLTSPLDYETTSKYLVPVIAEDDGNPKLQSETTVVIDVTDISDMPPKFEKSIYLKEIYENTPVGTSVQKVVARDGDTGINNPMKYEIYSGNDGSFAIDSSTGVITINNTIDAEKNLSYKLYVRASEVPDPSSNATVTVLFTVIDKNDNPPVFSKNLYTFTLREDLAKPGRIVTVQLIVTDTDKNPEFRRHTYHVTGGDSNKFSIDPSSGVLKINSTLDYETQVNYTFSIVVTEIGTAEKYSDNATVHLTLINDNDNKPIFANSSYYYTLDEEVPPGKEIAIITASDADAGLFGLITYELAGADFAFFQVDRNIGKIKTLRTLDYEYSKNYQISLLAKDGGGLYQQTDITVINISLRDVNDNEPVFSRPTYVKIMSKNIYPGEIVNKVTASDEDSGDNGRVSYIITFGNTENVFSINETGYVTSSKPLDKEKISYYILTIMAHDYGIPRRNSTATLKIYGDAGVFPVLPPLNKKNTLDSAIITAIVLPPLVVASILISSFVIIWKRKEYKDKKRQTTSHEVPMQQTFNDNQVIEETSSISANDIPERQSNNAEEYDNINMARPTVNRDLSNTNSDSRCYKIPSSASTQGVYQEIAQTQEAIKDTIDEKGYMSLVNQHTYESLKIKNRPNEESLE